MRYRVGIINYNSGIVEIVLDNIENRSVVKAFINHRLNQQTAWEKFYHSYFAEVLNDEGVWVNITDSWNYQAQEAVEELYDNGKISLDYLEDFLTVARYGFSDSVDYMLGDNVSEWYCS